MMGEILKRIFAWFGTFLSAVKQADFEKLRELVSKKVDKTEFDLRHSELREDIARMGTEFGNALASHASQARVDSREVRETMQREFSENRAEGLRREENFKREQTERDRIMFQKIDDFLLQMARSNPK